MPRTSVLSTGLNPRLARIDRLIRSGRTGDEIAEELGLTTRTVNRHIARLRKRSRELFRHERAAERAQAYEDCRRIQETLWEVIEYLMSDDPQHPRDPKAVPPVARAYLDTLKTREALRDADDKHVQDGELSVRDVYAQLGDAYLDEPTGPNDNIDDDDDGDHASPAEG